MTVRLGYVLGLEFSKRVSFLGTILLLDGIILNFLRGTKVRANEALVKGQSEKS